MKTYLKKLFKIFGKAAINTVNHEGIEHAGYMAFMILLCIFPFIVFFTAVAGFFGASSHGKELIQLLLESLPSNVTELIKGRIYEIIDAPPPSLLTLAVFGMIWTASSFVEAIRTILNRIYHVKSPPSYIFRRILSILQFLILILFLFLAAIILVFIPIILSQIESLKHLIPAYDPMNFYLRKILFFCSLLFVISTMYYAIPNLKLKFIDILPGSLVTATLFIVSARLLSQYVIYYTQLSVIYGSLGNIIITLLFFYIINTIFIYGAEFNYLLQKEAN
ncbi:MAG: YihY/virulence factor BrkB family protein [Rickettsiaceae bacterium]|nr:YihY/virulence factor BrkB family protein [Rickettsiaceae bacterium]